MPKVACPYDCSWKMYAFLERTAEIARETHLAVCLSAPRRRDIQPYTVPHKTKRRVG